MATRKYIIWQDNTKLSFEINVTISLYFVALFQCNVLASVASLSTDN